jgi:hypothetical protein
MAFGGIAFLRMLYSQATQKAAGYPGLAKGRATRKAAGWTGLAKGRATQKAAGYPDFYNVYQAPAAYQDLVFNVCCELAGIESVDKDYFMFKASSSNRLTRELVDLAVYEKETQLLDGDVVRRLFQDLIKAEPDRFPSGSLPTSKSGSHVGWIVRLFSEANSLRLCHRCYN